MEAIHAIILVLIIIVFLGMSVATREKSIRTEKEMRERGI